MQRHQSGTLAASPHPIESRPLSLPGLLGLTPPRCHAPPPRRSALGPSGWDCLTFDSKPRNRLPLLLMISINLHDDALRSTALHVKGADRTSHPGRPWWVQRGFRGAGNKGRVQGRAASPSAAVGHVLHALLQRDMCCRDASAGENLAFDSEPSRAAPRAHASSPSARRPT